MAGRVTFTCPRCGMTSGHPMDVQEGYCGNCHDWTGKGVVERPDENADHEDEPDASTTRT